MTERKIKNSRFRLSPKRDRTETQNITMCFKRIIALKYRPILLWAIILNGVKTLSAG